jgi:hypothetical protein
MDQAADDPDRRPGRPRKWADDAERARAYRLRRAADLADPEGLRAERRTFGARARDCRYEVGMGE